MKYMGVNAKYELSVVPIEETELFYSAQSQVRDQETGCIGHMRQDYGRDGMGFWTSWTDHCPELKTQVLKDEFDNIINALKNGVLRNRTAMTVYCRANLRAKIAGGREHNYGFKITTDNHIYYLRCCPLQNDYNLYAYAYDRSRLEMCLPSLSETGINAELKRKLEKTAEFILETAARETRSGHYILDPYDIPAEIISSELYTEHIDTIKDMLNNYESIADIIISPSNAFYVDLFIDYCPNYEPLPEEVDDYPIDRKTLNPLESKRVSVTGTPPSDAVDTKPSLMSRLAENKEKAARHGQAEHHKTKNQEAVL